MQDLQYDTTHMEKFGDFITHKKDRSTAKDTPPTGNDQWMKKQNAVRHSSITDTFNNADPKQTTMDIIQKDNAKRESDRMFINELEKRKTEEQNTRHTTFGNKQLSRTTNKYTAISESRKTHQGNTKQGGKYSRRTRTRTRKGMRKTRSKSKKNYRKHYRKNSKKHSKRR